MHRKLTSLLFGLACAVCVFSSSQSNAALIIELTSGIDTVTVVDDGPGDQSDTTPGIVTFSGQVGDFIASVSSGISEPLVGSSTDPQLTLDSINISGTNAGTLTVRLTNTDFTAPIGNVIVPFDLVGRSDGDVSIAAFLDTTNTEFGTGTAVGAFGPVGGDVFSESSAVLTSISGPYSATLEAVIVHDDAFDSTTFSGELSVVPEPSSLVLIGLGGLLIGYRRWRR